MRKGYTLIEITLVLAIMGVITSCSIFSFKYYKDVQNKIEVDYNCNAVISFINNSKIYCKKNSCSAVLTFALETNLLMLDRSTTIVKKLTLPKNITLCDFTGTQDENHMKIDRMGSTGDAVSITLEDKNKEIYIITMGVGTVYVNRK